MIIINMVVNINIEIDVLSNLHYKSQYSLTAVNNLFYLFSIFFGNNNTN